MDTFYYILWFDVSLKKYYIMIYVLLLYLFYFILNILFSFGFTLSPLYYNSNYLWSLFRLNTSKSKQSWIEDNDTIQILDFYTDQFINLEISDMDISVEGKDKDSSLGASILDYRRQQAFLKNFKKTFVSDINKLKSLSVKKKSMARLRLKKLVIDLVEKKITMLNKLREQFGVDKLTKAVYNDFETAMDFNYIDFF